MTGDALITAILQILGKGISETATQVAGGLSELVQGIMFTTTGEGAQAVTTLSAFGIVVLCLAGVSLGLALMRWVVNFISSLGARNR